MWRKVPLRHRLNLMFVALFALWLAVDVGRILADAGPRVQAEAGSASRLTQEFLETSLANLQNTPDPEQAVRNLVSNLQYLRHVRVGLGENAFASALVTAPDPDAAAPSWFRALVHAPTGVTTIPVVARGRLLDWIVILADPTEVVGEVWRQARREAIGGGLLALAVLVATSVFVRISLRPLAVAGDVLARLEAGDFGARAEMSGSPEFVDICARINRLGEALSHLSAANRQLLQRALDAHDEERKAIARELHDEIGPHLFALRANAAILASRIGAGAVDGAAGAAGAIRDAVEALQRQNRRILASLRPAALEELGLAAALGALAEQWRRAEPNVEVRLAIAPEVERLGSRASLALYRFVQEALTNAFRHSGARRVSASLTYETPTGPAELGDPALRGLRVRVSDDGCGVGPDIVEGMGITGMRQRVRALGGDFALRAAPERGAVAEARFGLRE
jgi:two-component system sensor histidine kinase UhpB